MGQDLRRDLTASAQLRPSRPLSPPHRDWLRKCHEPCPTTLRPPRLPPGSSPRMKPQGPLTMSPCLPTPEPQPSRNDTANVITDKYQIIFMNREADDPPAGHRKSSFHLCPTTLRPPRLPPGSSPRMKPQSPLTMSPCLPTPEPQPARSLLIGGFGGRIAPK